MKALALAVSAAVVLGAGNATAAVPPKVWLVPQVTAAVAQAQENLRLHHCKVVYNHHNLFASKRVCK